jgi:hypothetical protein
LGIIRSVGKSRSVYPVFLFNKDNAGGRAEILKDLIEFYSCMIKNMVEKTKNVNFFFSNYPKDFNMHKLMEDIIEGLQSHEMMKTVLKEVLYKMEGKASVGKLLILDPLDGERMRVLNQILKTEPITDPRNEFTLNILQRSQAKLSRQLDLHEKNILEAVRIADVDFARWKLKELIQLSKIFNEHVNDYQQNLEEVVRKVFDTVKLKTSAV